MNWNFSHVTFFCDDVSIDDQLQIYFKGDNLSLWSTFNYLSCYISFWARDAIETSFWASDVIEIDNWTKYVSTFYMFLINSDFEWRLSEFICANYNVICALGLWWSQKETKTQIYSKTYSWIVFWAENFYNESCQLSFAYHVVTEKLFAMNLYN